MIILVIIYHLFFPVYFITCLNFISLIIIIVIILQLSICRGTLNGNGDVWWNIPLIGYAIYVEDRPRLLVLDRVHDVIIQHVLFVASPL